MTMKFRFRSKLSGATKVDRAAGILRGVQVCSIGAAKGHGVLVDQETLNRLNALAGKVADGIRLRFNPETFSHGEGSIAGRLDKGTFSIGEDGILRADAVVMKSYAAYDYLFDLAETQPDTIALSVEFDGEPEELNGVKYARPTEFMGAAIVDMGAATSGLFAVAETATKETQTTQPSETNMPAFTSEQMEALKGLFAEALKPMQTQLAALTATNDDEKEPDLTGMSEADVAAERLAAGVKEGDDKKTAARRIHAYRKEANKPVTVKDLTGFFSRAGGFPVSGGAQDMRRDDGTKCEFTAKVDAMCATGVNRQSAVKACITSFPKLHAAFIRRQMNGASRVAAA